MEEAFFGGFADELEKIGLGLVKHLAWAGKRLASEAGKRGVKPSLGQKLEYYGTAAKRWAGKNPVKAMSLATGAGAAGAAGLYGAKKATVG